MGIKANIIGALLVLLSLGSLAFWGHSERQGRQEAEKAAETAQDRLKESELNRSIEAAIADGYALVDQIYTQRLKDAQDEIDNLRGAVAAGSVELRVVSAECRDPVPENTGSASVGNSGSPRLKREFEPAYYAHAEGVERNEQALRACVAAYSELKKRTPD